MALFDQLGWALRCDERQSLMDCAAGAFDEIIIDEEDLDTLLESATEETRRCAEAMLRARGVLPEGR